MTDYANLDEWFIRWPKAKEVWDKLFDYGEVVWQYEPGKARNLPFVFSDDVEVIELSLDGMSFS